MNVDRSARMRFIGLTMLGGFYFLYARLMFNVSQPFIVCPFRLLTGIDCPLCGLTRSIGAFLLGDVRASLAFNRLGPFVVCGSCVLLVTTPIRWFRGSRVESV